MDFLKLIFQLKYNTFIICLVKVKLVSHKKITMFYFYKWNILLSDFQLLFILYLTEIYHQTLSIKSLRETKPRDSVPDDYNK